MHLDDYTIARYLDGQVAGQEKQQVDAHLAACPACSEAVAAAYRMVQAVATTHAPRPDRAAVQRAERLAEASPQASWLDGLFGRPLRLALAAVVVASLGLIAYFGVLAPDHDRFRATPSSPAFVAMAPPDGAVIEAQPLVFVWEPLDDVVRYRLTLFTDEASVHWEGDTLEETATLPDTVRLAAGAQYLWRIDAVLENGSTLATELYAFTVAP